MAQTEGWRQAHEEAGAELGAIRFSERMPPKYKWLIIPGVLAVVVLALCLAMWAGGPAAPPPAGGGPAAREAQEQAHRQEVDRVIAAAAAVIGVVLFGGGVW